MQNHQALDYLQERLNNQHPIKQIKNQEQALQGMKTRLLAKHPKIKIQDAKSTLEGLHTRMSNSLRQTISSTKRRQEQSEKALQKASPIRQIHQQQQNTSSQLKALSHAYQQVLKDKQSQLSKTAALLDTVSPLATLSRGYSISFHGEKIIRSAQALGPNDNIVTKLADGEVHSVVTKTVSNK